MKTSELDYVLPDDLIAREPPTERDGGRMLVVDRATGALRDAMVRDLPSLLPARSLLVVNDTRVIPARLFATKPSGGKVELLLTEKIASDPTGETWRAMARPLKSLHEGTRLEVSPTLVASVQGKREDEVEIRLETRDGSSVRDAIGRVGELPIPPYLGRSPTAADAERYQTVYAREEGAVAAPTAGLHLSPRLLAELDAAGHERVALTLHVGSGTFLPIRGDELSQHVMHEERYLVSPDTLEKIGGVRGGGRRVVAVGTTVVRALESGSEGRTSIFIYPPQRVRSVDALLTNFHLPRSTLLALVMAFGGVEQIRAAYAHAVRERYRFYSYGDAMLIV